MNTKETLLVQKYANSFVEQVSDLETVWDIYQEIEVLISIIQTSRLNRILQDATVSEEEKANFVHTIRQSRYPDVNALVSMIIEDGKTKYLLDILREVLQKISKLQNEYEAVLTSVYPLSALQKERLKDIVEKKFHLKVRTFIEKIDASLLGGFTVSVNHRVIDASVRSQLEEMKNKL